jgi:hypothetical protein
MAQDAEQIAKRGVRIIIGVVVLVVVVIVLAIVAGIYLF